MCIRDSIHALSQTACLTFAAVIADGAIFQQVVFSAGAISGKRHAGQGEGASAFCVIPRGQLIQQEEVKQRIKFIRQIRVFAVSYTHLRFFAFKDLFIGTPPGYFNAPS